MTGAVAVPGRGWFERPAVQVAQDLLGSLVRTDRDGATVVLRVTEVEAYAGAEDPVSHAYRGPTPRTASMFGSGGHLYVYRHLGLHHCVNVVTGPAGVAGAVLLRAGEVVEGAAAARARRTAAGVVRRDVDLARGPARLVVALGLGPDDDGLDLLAGVPTVGLEVPGHRLTARSGPRIGVGAQGSDPVRFGWRFWLPDEPTVSASRPSARTRASGRRKDVTAGRPRTAD